MAFKIMIPFAYIVAVLLASDSAEAAIGVNWGRQSAQRLVPSQVVDLLLQNGVGQARIYSSDDDILRAFAGSGISLTVTIFNGSALSSPDDARKWVQKRAPHFSPSNIRAIYLGNYVFSEGLKNKASLHSAITSLQYLQNALNEAGYGDQVKATFPHLQTELKNMTRPSEAEFRDEIKEEIITTLRFLQENNAPFPIAMFPILDVSSNNFDFSFAFPDNKSTQVVRDINGAVYTNVFEFRHDSFVWALNKLNASNMKIIVSQVGWPTDGCPGANATTAERFYKSLLPMVVSNKGTPMRPGVPIDTYVQALTDENKLPYSIPFMRHWGIYRSNGQPKYKIDLSGQGRDIFPTTMKGIMHMPQRWCIFNGNGTRLDPQMVKMEFGIACAGADCTSLARGGSCSRLSFEQNISYAFNMFFQFRYQDEKACDFQGLGVVSVDDPSTDECVFPIEVVKGLQINFYDNAQVVQWNKGLHEMPNCAILVFLLSILGTLLIWN